MDLIFKTWSQILSIFFICKNKKVVIFRLSVESLLWYSLPKKTILNRLAKYDTYSIVMCYQDLLRLFDRHLKSLDTYWGFLVQYQDKVLILVKLPGIDWFKWSWLRLLGIFFWFQLSQQKSWSWLRNINCQEQFFIIFFLFFETKIEKLLPILIMIEIILR